MFQVLAISFSFQCRSLYDVISERAFPSPSLGVGHWIVVEQTKLSSVIFWLGGRGGAYKGCTHGEPGETMYRRNYPYGAIHGIVRYFTQRQTENNRENCKNKQTKQRNRNKNSECHLTSVTVQRELLSNGNSFLVNMDPTWSTTNFEHWFVLIALWRQQCTHVRSGCTGQCCDWQVVRCTEVCLNICYALSFYFFSFQDQPRNAD